MFMVISIHDAFTSGGSATVNFQLSTSAASNHSSPVVLWQSGVLAFNNALLGAGKSFIFRIPKGALRYLRVNQIVAGAALTAGSFDAFITDNVDSYIGQ